MTGTAGVPRGADVGADADLGAHVDVGAGDAADGSMPTLDILDAVTRDHTSSDAGCAPDTGILRGTRDPSWSSELNSPPGKLSDWLLRGALLDARGRVYLYGFGAACSVGARVTSFLVVRHRADGSLDADFGTRGVACFSGPRPTATVKQFLGGAVDDTGRVYLAGQTGETRNTVAVVTRLTEDGELDGSFNRGQMLALRPTPPPGVSSSNEMSAYGVVDGGDALYVAGGDWATFGFVERVTLDGVVDGAFSAAAGASQAGISGWYASGRSGSTLVLAGHRLSDLGLLVRRLRMNGDIDSTWGADGLSTALPLSYAIPRGLVVLPDGAVVVAAASQDADINRARATAVRFTPGGALDETFAAGGAHVSAHYFNQFYDLSPIAASCSGNIFLTAHNVSAATGRYAYLDALDRRGRLDRSFGPQGGVLGRHSDHAPVAVLIDRGSQWIYFVTRSNTLRGYAIERIAL